jgi:hypothetical protein
MEIEGLKVVHALPGRVRLKVSKVKGNPALARQAQEKLAKVPGIREVEAKPGTGSLLINYDTEHLFSIASLEILSETLGELFPEIEAVTMAAWLGSLAENPGYETGVSPAGSISGSPKLIRGSRIDLKVLIPLVLLFFGLRSFWFSEKGTVPAWHDYFWFAFSSFFMLRGIEGKRS